MNKIIVTNSGNTAALIARLALAFTIFPHGAQKLLGWFGGYGFTGTMGFFTETAGLPWIVAFMVIMIEFFAPLFIILGIGTRIAAFALFAMFIGVLFTQHIHNGFFMNWGMEAGKGEGWEYFIMLFGLTITLMITGGGKASLDATLPINKK